MTSTNLTIPHLKYAFSPPRVDAGEQGEHLNIQMCDRLKVGWLTLVGPLWERYHESRRSSRVSYPQSCITKYDSTRGQTNKNVNLWLTKVTAHMLFYYFHLPTVRWNSLPPKYSFRERLRVPAIKIICMTWAIRLKIRFLAWN